MTTSPLESLPPDVLANVVVLGGLAGWLAPLSQVSRTMRVLCRRVDAETRVWQGLSTAVFPRVGRLLGPTGWRVQFVALLGALLGAADAELTTGNGTARLRRFGWLRGGLNTPAALSTVWSADCVATGAAFDLRGTQLCDVTHAGRPLDIVHLRSGWPQHGLEQGTLLRARPPQIAELRGWWPWIPPGQGVFRVACRARCIDQDDAPGSVRYCGCPFDDDLGVPAADGGCASYALTVVATLDLAMVGQPLAARLMRIRTSRKRGATSRLP